MIVSRITSTIAAGVVAAALAAPVLAAGEAKNESPFNRPAEEQPFVQGEPKNELPFTAPQGVHPTLVIGTTDAGFSWADAAIGAAAGVGALSIVGGLAVLTLASRRRVALH
jgi:hypothetical protein